MGRAIALFLCILGAILAFNFGHGGLGGILVGVGIFIGLASSKS